MRNYSHRELREYASRAFDAIDEVVDSKIWRTNQRIMELVLRNNQGNSNPYFQEPLWFTDILVRRLFYGGLTAAYGSTLVSEGERFEESDSEPVLIGDLKDQGDDRYAAIFRERMIYSLFLTGMNFDEAQKEFFRVFDGRLHLLESAGREGGMFSGSLFYRRVDDPRREEEAPKLPAEPVVMY